MTLKQAIKIIKKSKSYKGQGKYPPKELKAMEIIEKELIKEWNTEK